MRDPQLSASPSALDGVVVLDLTSGVAGAYATKLLADLGARVVLVEDPGGSPLRARGRRAGGRPDGALFEHLSGGKASVVVPDDRSAAARLVRGAAGLADVIVTDGTVAAAALLPSQLPEAVVAIDVSPFGRSGPYAGWRGSDLATWAMGGYLFFTGAPDREPVWLPGSQASLHGGVHAAFAALVALHERRRSGFGQRVEVSELEAVLGAHAWLASSWAACGLQLNRVPNDLVRMRDGWAYVMRIAPREELFVLIERPDLAAENLTASVPTWLANVERVFEAVAEWAKEHTVAEIVELGQALRVAVTPVLDPLGVRDDEQLAARQWWEHDDETGTGLRFPGQPYHLAATPSRRRGAAPRLGEHTEELLAEVSAAEAKASPASPARPPAAPAGNPPRGLPLAGLRVLEVTSNWAGPLCGRHLADLGAEVTKIEWAMRPAARALFWVGPTQDPQRQGHNRAMYFNELNRNKRDVCLDLSVAAGRDVFLRLVADADVVIENNSARVMGNLGLDWPALSAVNPRLVMVSMSGYGADGPRRDWLAYGSNIETTCGLTSLTGYADGTMSRTTLFYADPVSGNHGAVAVLAALAHRDRTGEGQWVEMSLNECGAAYNAEALMDLAADGTVRRPNGNRDPRFAPHGVYPCAGFDHWVAIACQSDDDWGGLCAAMGRADLATDPALATLAGRQARHDELDAAIGAWTATLEQYEVAWALQRRGISAAPVLANWQILADPHLYAREVFQPIVHPVVGVYPTTTWPWHFARTPATLRSPAPLFAEHNRLVLTDAGLSDAEIEALYAAGITVDDLAS